MAPAWLTVAMPAIIDPRTRKISNSGGTNARATLNTKDRSSNLPSYGTTGAIEGRISAATKI